VQKGGGIRVPLAAKQTNESSRIESMWRTAESKAERFRSGGIVWYGIEDAPTGARTAAC